jgi:ABC-type bacteriocin/lantibiotic exporter with double-glycine peptidase domain
MQNRYLISALQALAISLPLAAIVGFAMGEFSWRLAIVATILVAVVWIVMVGRAPKLQDSLPPDPMPGSE